MPNFVETRKLIQVAAAEIGAKVSGRRAKHLAGQMLTQNEDYSTLTYSDPTALAAVREWMKSWAETMDPAPKPPAPTPASQPHALAA